MTIEAEKPRRGVLRQHKSQTSTTPSSESERNAAMHNATLRSMKQSVKFDDFEAMLVEHEQQQEKTRESMNTEQSRVAEMENIGWKLLAHLSDSTFLKKYGVDFSTCQAIHSYLFTQQPRQYTYVFEAFANVTTVPKDALKNKKEEIVFHSMFEDVIERYTRSRAKPNPVLLETRNSEFCYRLAIMVEAVPCNVQNNIGFNMSTLRLVREYMILYHLWEKYREEFQAKACTSDHLVGIPMPFEFVNVTGTEFDFDMVKVAINYFDIHGAYLPSASTRLPVTGRPLSSFLSYMSIEKLGPSLSFLGDLLKSQKRWFSLSTALKILDQIICRLMVLHRYGVILGNMDTKFLNFGVREAINVLYVNNFDCSVAVPISGKPIQCYNERFASTGVLKATMHFVNDIETAFYVFLSLLVPRLPWDDKDQSENRPGSWSILERNRNLRLHLDERQKMWDNPASLERLLHSFQIHTEASTPVLQSFALDIILSVYGKIKEAIASCSNIPLQDFMANTMTVSTVPHNAYTNIRKVIVSFFRFESLSNGLRDATCLNKVERLVEVESTDARALWDLNDWCWNIFETSYLGGSRRLSSKSVKL